MKFYDVITKNTIRDEINRICGATDENYLIRDKVARVNQALDRYWQLASDSAPKGTFDDTSQTSAPIEKQNIVSGTNEYKLTDFTNEVLQILKVSVLLDDGVTETDLIREEFDNYHDFLQWYSTSSQGTPSFWTKYGDFIYLRPTPNYSETNGLRAYVNRELSKYEYVTFTTTNASNQIDATGHGLSNGDTVILSTDNTLPAGYSADTTIYYVINKATDSFQVATAGGGSAVVITNDGTGTHKFLHISKSPGIPVIHHDYLARYAAMPYLIEKKLSQAGTNMQRIALDERSIQEYWINRGRELSTIIRPRQRRFR